MVPFRTIGALWRPDRELPAGLHIVRGTDEWTRLWWSACDLPPDPPTLDVNWQTEMCILAALGTRSTGGYHVLIDLIEVSDGQMTVLVWEIRPGPRCGTTRALTHPFHAVAAPARAGTAKLVKRVAYEDCGAVEY